jgi:MFS family permease
LLGNTVGAVAGIVGPIVVSAFVTAWPGTAGWRAAFLLTFGLSTVAYMVWWVYIKAEIVPALNTPKPVHASR